MFSIKLLLLFALFVSSSLSKSSYQDDIQVSHFLAKTKQILGTDAGVSSRSQRYLPEAMNAVNESFSDLVDLILGFINLIIDNLMHLDWSRPTMRDFLPNIDDSQIVLYESIATIILGKFIKCTSKGKGMIRCQNYKTI